MNHRQLAERTMKEVTRADWVYLGIGYFCPHLEPTVDAFDLDGHELRAYPRKEGPTRCEITDYGSGHPVSLWVEGVPDAALVGRLMEEHKDILVATSWGIGKCVLDLATGEVLPEREVRYPDL